MKKTILTGIRPTGNLHLGHYFGACKNWVKLQDEYETFIEIAAGKNIEFDSGDHTISNKDSNITALF